MRVVFSKYAKQELDDAAHFYELEYEEPGVKFKEEVKAVILRIARHPRAWSIERGDIRKGLLARFPYKILYSVEEEHIFVIAVAHQHRRPDHWIENEEA